MKYISKSVIETEKIANDFLGSIEPNENDATVVGLYGDLGSGKTTFTKLIAKNLGIGETVTSPTFVIEKIYKLKKGTLGDFEHLIHIDCYRLNNKEEILKLGFDEIVSNPKNLIFIEWPEKIGSALPSHRKLQFKFIDENTRQIEIG